METETILILDYGGQYKQLIARRIRECHVYCEILPHTTPVETIRARRPRGIVLTGGCCALEGIDEIAEKVFKKPVRIGYPKGTSGIQEAFHKPSYATGIGLLHYAARQQSVNKKHDTGAQLTVSVKKGIQWFKDMVRTYF